MTSILRGLLFLPIVAVMCCKPESGSYHSESHGNGTEWAPGEKWTDRFQQWEGTLARGYPLNHPGEVWVFTGLRYKHQNFDPGDGYGLYFELRNPVPHREGDPYVGGLPIFVEPRSEDDLRDCERLVTGNLGSGAPSVLTPHYVATLVNLTADVISLATLRQYR
ncbi:MAG: hypothetical protein IPM29_17155 [Planctomycetes bacterium]|nr:hypothetical protein [Planctomycetota bacterium]